MQKLRNSLIISLFSFFYVLNRDKEAYMQYHKIVQFAMAWLWMVRMSQLEELAQNRIESIPQAVVEDHRGASTIHEIRSTKE